MIDYEVYTPESETCRRNASLTNSTRYGRLSMTAFYQFVLPILIICVLFATILSSIEIGYRTGLRRRTRATEFTQGESKAIETSVFGLMGLLIAFIFAGAAVRFDNRRMLIAEEANVMRLRTSGSIGFEDSQIKSRN